MDAEKIVDRKKRERVRFVLGRCHEFMVSVLKIHGNGWMAG